MLKLSMILPIYNVGDYLKDCLDSCLCQDLSEDEYEIICVNDGSTDNSATIIAEYVSKHANVICVEQINSGLAAARNAGSTIAKGQYIWFIDSDDFIEANVAKSLINFLDADNIDVLVFNYKSVQQNDHFQNVSTEIKDEPADLEHFGAHGIWAAIYKRSFLVDNKIEFNRKLRFAEDTLFLFYINLANGKMKKIKDILYNYRQRDTSLTHLKTANDYKNNSENMAYMATVYKDHYANFGGSNAKRRQYWAVKAALSFAMFVDPVYAKKFRMDLKQKGLYPIPILWEFFAPTTSIKQTLMNWAYVPFGLSLYYDLVCKLLAIFVTKRNGVDKT